LTPHQSRYAGYHSYQYLEAGVDFQEFVLATEIGRVAPYAGVDLSEVQIARAASLLDGNITISLHDHLSVYPANITQAPQLIRTGRDRTGYEGLARSGLTALFDNFLDGIGCITSQCGWKWGDVLADVGMRYCDFAHQDFVVRAERLDDVRQAHATGRVAVIPGLEAATMIENELDRIDILYGFGIRQMGITYNEANALGSGLKENSDGGLTSFGHRAVKRMNQLGMAIDLSHAGDTTSLDVIATSSKPVLITHAGARSVWNTRRMKPDIVLKACAARGGLIGVEAAPHTTISEAHPRHCLDSIMDHFTYLVETVGIEHVAFGPDTIFGDHAGLHLVMADRLSLAAAQGQAHEKVEFVDGVENPGECFRNIVAWLIAHGYSDEEIIAVTGANVMRVLEQIWV
jgi:membrane dipeptidase